MKLTTPIAATALLGLSIVAGQAGAAVGPEFRVTQPHFPVPAASSRAVDTDHDTTPTRLRVPPANAQDIAVDHRTPRALTPIPASNYRVDTETTSVADGPHGLR